MADTTWTDIEISAWLDEMLSADSMAAIETELRSSESLRNRVARIIRERDSGTHTVGEIWRRGRISCPERSELGSYLLGTLDDAPSEYIDFHLRTMSCRVCAANLLDLEEQSKSAEETSRRRNRLFQSSAGHLRDSGDATVD